MFRFSIRELFLVTMIVALAVGWWVDRQSLVLRIRDYEARDKMIEAQGKMIFESTVLPNPSAPTTNPPKI